MSRQPHPSAPEWAQPIEIANHRVGLALLRIYRSMPIRFDEMDLTSAMRPFWPQLRERPDLLRAAVLGAPPSSGATRGRGRRRWTTEPDNETVDSVRKYLDAHPELPADLPDSDLFELLATGLMRNKTAYRPVFEALQQRLEELVGEQEVPSDRNIAMLGKLLGLDLAEERFLALCCAVQWSSIGSSPFAVVAHTTRIVQALEAALGMSDEHDIRAMLRTNGRLVRAGFVERNFGVQRDLEDVLRLTRQGLNLLAAKADTVDDMACAVLQPLQTKSAESGLHWPHLEERGQLVERALTRAMATGEEAFNLLVYGPPGTGKSQWVRRVVEKIGARGYAIADTDIDGDPASGGERLGNLLLTQLFAPAGHSVLVLDEAEDVFQTDYNNPFALAMGKGENFKSWMNSLLESNRVPVVWITNRISHMDPAILRRFSYILEFPTPPRGVRRHIAQSHLAALGCSEEVISSVGCDEHVSPALLASAARFATLSGSTGPLADAAVRSMLTDSVKAMGGKIQARVPTRATRFDTRYLNVSGPIGTDAVLTGLQRTGRATVLLSGPPGTGKTQLASEVAMLLGRELKYRTASDINTMWFGESERNVARMFEECDSQGEVLFLDEADTLLSSREGGQHRANIAVTSEFLRQIEAFSGVFICATNHRDALDPALMRRFGFRLDFQPLTTAQRADLFRETALGWDGASESRPDVPPEVLSRLAHLDQLTPGDFANVVKRVRTLDLTLDPVAWVAELEGEHAVKPGARRAGIGFL